MNTAIPKGAKASNGRKRKLTPGAVVLEVISIIFALVCFFPLIWMIFVSLKADEMSLKTPFHYFLPPFTIEHYIDVLGGGTKVVRWFMNSLGVAAIVTVLVTLFCSMASYALAKMKFYGRTAFYYFFLIGLMVPGEATIVSLFVWCNKLKIIDTYAGLILPSLAGSMNIIIMTSFLTGIPNDLIDAARIDGAGELSTYINVILPLSRTVIVTISIFTFIGNWNSYLWPYLCAMSEDLFTLPVGIPTFISQFTVDKTIPMTVNTIASLPILVFFCIFEKQIVKGISLTGIKG